MRRRGSPLQNGRRWSEFRRWALRNLNDPDIFDKIDWDEEVDKSLTFLEAKSEIKKKLQAIWQDKPKQGRVKKIVFIKPIIDKIVAGEVCISYRKTRKLGLYYVVESRFQRPCKPRAIVEFYRSEKVDPYGLKDEDAQLAGIECAQELLKKLRTWYGDPIPKLYRNWFRVVEVF
ncbi:MAG: hypothetical protein QW815_05190 [Nitrososphaerota archaeon]